MFEQFEIVEQSTNEMKLKDKKTGELHRRYKATCSSCGEERGWKKKFKTIGLCKSCALHLEAFSKIDPILYPNVNLQDFTIYTKKTSGSERRYKTTCLTCKKDRGYIPLSAAPKECRSCVRKTVHKNTPNEQKMLTAQKISMTQIGATIFNGFTTPEDERQRSIYKSKGLSKQCFERDDYTCQICSTRGCALHAHHMNGFDMFPDERFDLDNLTTLCEPCHDRFHSEHGRGSNTKEQYDLFKTSQVKSDATFDNGCRSPLKPLYILTGAPASGKSWVLSHLTNFNCLDSDIIPKKDLVDRCKAAARPLLTLTIGVSTFIKRNPDFDIKLVVIVEGIDILNNRMLARDGKVTATIERRAKRMDALAKQAVFSGSSTEVLEYLKSSV